MRLQFVPPRTSHKELVENIHASQVQLQGCKAMLLEIGHVDVCNRAIPIKDSPMPVKWAINDQDPTIIMFVCIPMPWHQDQPLLARKLCKTTNMLGTTSHKQPIFMQYWWCKWFVKLWGFVT